MRLPSYEIETGQLPVTLFPVMLAPPFSIVHVPATFENTHTLAVVGVEPARATTVEPSPEILAARAHIPLVKALGAVMPALWLHDPIAALPVGGLY